jgi:translation initiation factor 1A
MVKNTHGGSGHKKFGRKYTSNKPNNRLRIALEEGEEYAIVTKMLGNNMFHCHCIDNVLRLGHIRGKFAGRGKRDNMISCGTWVLIGVREWDIDKKEVTGGKLQQCDLLEVYSESDKDYLKDTVDAHWITLINNDISRTKTQGDNNNEEDGFNFVTEKDMERQKFIEEMKSEATEKISLKIQESNNENNNNDIYDDEVNIDDI